MNKSAFIYEIYILVYSRNVNTNIQYKYKETRYYIITQIKIKQMTKPLTHVPSQNCQKFFNKIWILS